MNEEITGVFLLDGDLFYRKGDMSSPVVDKHINGKVYYNKEILSSILDMIKADKVPELKRYYKQIIHYYENIDIIFDINERKQINNELKALIAEAKQEDVDLILDFKGMSNIHYIYVHRVRVPFEKRRQKIGTKYMDKIISIAKSHNLYVGLDISNALGTPKYKLQRFYKQLGFKKCNRVGIDTEVYL